MIGEESKIEKQNTYLGKPADKDVDVCENAEPQHGEGDVVERKGPNIPPEARFTHCLKSICVICW